MTGRPAPPAERVRARIARSWGDTLAGQLPSGYQRLGRVLVVRLPESLRDAYPDIGRAWQRELGVDAVLRHAGRTDGEWRHPRVERIAGDSTETELLEHGVRYRFDAAEIMFAAGNAIERRRIGRLVRPGETVVDLFAGIGYFSIPVALPGRATKVYAVEANPASFRYLVENIRRNGVESRVAPFGGDNRAVDLPLGVADRVLLGLLPTSIPFIERAVEVARPAAWLHVHGVAGVRDGASDLLGEVRSAVERTGRQVRENAVREVKPYGPGRAHFVVDARLG